MPSIPNWKPKPPASSSIDDLKKGKHESPNWIHKEEEYADRVREAIALCEWVPEPSWSPDVFLQQVAPDYKANECPDYVAPYGVGKEAGSHH